MTLLAAADARLSRDEIAARFGLKPTSVGPIVCRLRQRFALARALGVRPVEFDAPDLVEVSA